MSHYVSRLKSRNFTPWPETGRWSTEGSVSHLNLFAANLDVPAGGSDADPLKSVPSPWARLLLFESALFSDSHPAHSDVAGQWRGLLGLFALSRSLGLTLTTTSVRVADFAGTTPRGIVAKTFADLNPDKGETATQREPERWEFVHLISVNGVDVGCTSPRSLVFTGVSQRAPKSVPFQEDGVLMDPVPYYRAAGDKVFLGLLRYWLAALIQKVQTNESLMKHMGKTPAAPGADAAMRQMLLLQALQAWEATMSEVEPVAPGGAYDTPFGGRPYSELLTIQPRYEPTDSERRSDLLLERDGHTIVCFDRDRGSTLLNAVGAELQTERIKIFDGRWAEASEPLPLPFDFLPALYKAIDLSALFAPALIQVNVPEDGNATHHLTVVDGTTTRHFLLPFDSAILETLSAADIHANTSVSVDRAANEYVVELAVRLRGNRQIRARKSYAIDKEVITGTTAQELAVWPDFVSPEWTQYFYVKTAVAQREVTFEPLGETVRRTEQRREWYFSSTPLKAFIGTIDGVSGLLPLRQDGARVKPGPTSAWRVSVDFGSTHTRAYAMPMEQRDHRLVPRGPIMPIRFHPRTVALTQCAENVLANHFFVTPSLAVDARAEQLKTLLMCPVNASEAEVWLPREGFVYLGSLVTHDYDSSRLRQNLKWQSSSTNYEVQAFLRCLLTMIDAEAFANGARVAEIIRSYPSVFTPRLRGKHNADWLGLANYINLRRTEPVKFLPPLTESVAVCRHLEANGAPVAANAIAIDVGGGSTDIAVWAGGELKVQESVKLAGGVIGRFVEWDGPDAKSFREWLQAKVAGPPYRIEGIDLDEFQRDPSGISLLFNEILSTAERKGMLDTLVEEIVNAAESEPLRAHAAYLFSALFYYAGLLARKVKLHERTDGLIYLYVCGRGGQFLSWIAGAEQLARDAFRSGLAGPNPPAGQTLVEVEVVTSSFPKEEVGRGLLAQGAPAEGGQRRNGLRIVEEPTITVGEQGYTGFAWDGHLTPESMKTLDSDKVPQCSQLLELAAFRTMFSSGAITSRYAAVLPIAAVDDRRLRDSLVQRLFGRKAGAVMHDLTHDTENALLEPLLITELKVLLETVVKNPNLFNDPPQ